MTYPPGPTSTIAKLAQTRAFFRGPLREMEKMHALHGKAASLSILGERVLFLFDPELIGEVLVDRGGAFVKDNVTHSLSYLLGEGLLTSELPKWRRQRRLIAPSLNRRHIASYGDSMVSAARRYVDTLVDGEVRDVHADMTAVTLEIVTETLFGAAFSGAEEIGAKMDVVMHNFERVVRSWRRLVPEWVPLKPRRQIAEAGAVIEAKVRAIIRERQESGCDGDDLLSRLLAARDESGEGMDEDQIYDEALTLFVAGHETTANALTFGLKLIAEHPEVDLKLKREVDAALGGRPATAADLPQLPYTEAVFKEVLRLYPPAYLIGRESTAEVELGPFTVPKGTTVLISPWVLHRDRASFDDPMAFAPERWLDGRTEGVSRYAYMPFGGGPRICVGNHFAMMEGILALATFVQHVRLERTSREELPLQFAVTARPARPLRMRVVRRTMLADAPSASH